MGNNDKPVKIYYRDLFPELRNTGERALFVNKITGGYDFFYMQGEITESELRESVDLQATEENILRKAGLIKNRADGDYTYVDLYMDQQNDRVIILQFKNNSSVDSVGKSGLFEEGKEIGGFTVKSNMIDLYEYGNEFEVFLRRLNTPIVN